MNERNNSAIHAEPFSLIGWVIQELFYLCRAIEEACWSIFYRLWLLLLRTSQHTLEKSQALKRSFTRLEFLHFTIPRFAVTSFVQFTFICPRTAPHIPPNWYLTNYISLIKDPIFNSIWIYLPVSTKLTKSSALRSFAVRGRWKSRTWDVKLFLDSFKCVPFLEWVGWI